uniref:AAA+ ATPase domain-containing protein n=1 Tax=Chromera velia CCMP2878 TaxID=1169474 RepID=A0A0G4G5R3_9ALVE|eukprot:Cvel_4197.t1-p1 / transcript=Cvel_4197.t1 / gene=Cvel_4197 / organism=Chromera_velia_CCMP2878 / gene_product=Protein CfxQ, putative / transcript_product=Protein CfxQ, putative / location=Cvel_scaffold181:39983-45699(-) / protein_length=1587 / sequence_SO=supercontig / SO=protein_coding / is_pseudo=false
MFAELPDTERTKFQEISSCLPLIPDEVEVNDPETFATSLEREIGDICKKDEENDGGAKESLGPCMGRLRKEVATLKATTKEQSTGCPVCCPFCNAKCHEVGDHTDHWCADHLLGAFRGCAEWDTDRAHVAVCTSRDTMDSSWRRRGDPESTPDLPLLEFVKKPYPQWLEGFKKVQPVDAAVSNEVVKKVYMGSRHFFLPVFGMKDIVPEDMKRYEVTDSSRVDCCRSSSAYVLSCLAVALSRLVLCFPAPQYWRSAGLCGQADDVLKSWLTEWATVRSGSADLKRLVPLLVELGEESRDHLSNALVSALSAGCGRNAEVLLRTGLLNHLTASSVVEETAGSEKRLWTVCRSFLGSGSFASASSEVPMSFIDQSAVVFGWLEKELRSQSMSPLSRFASGQLVGDSVDGTVPSLPSQLVPFARMLREGEHSLWADSDFLDLESDPSDDAARCLHVALRSLALCDGGEETIVEAHENAVTALKLFQKRLLPLGESASSVDCRLPVVLEAVLLALGRSLRVHLDRRLSAAGCEMTILYSAMTGQRTRADGGWLTRDDLTAMGRYDGPSRGLVSAEGDEEDGESVKRDALGKAWDELKERESLTLPSMDELMKMTGLETVKKSFLEMIRQSIEFRRLPQRSRVTVAHNFASVGNPGTGKTTVARLLAGVLRESGIRSRGSFVEMTAKQALRQGGRWFADRIQAARGGVLFIDEAYGLDPENERTGREILEEILRAAEDLRGELSIVVAGYRSDLQDKLFSYNAGLAGRFREIVFEDFRASQLRSIWTGMLEEKDWKVESPNVTNVAINRLVRRAGRKGFGNVREVRQLFESAVSAAAGRGITSAPTLMASDIVGAAPSRSSNAVLDEALKALEKMEGLREVKRSLNALVERVVTNHDREMRGERPLDVPLNRVFLGNPGTGKTTVAKIWGRVLKALGLLSKGSVVEKTGSDFVQGYLGQSQGETKKILAAAQGMVLIIDEAYVLGQGDETGRSGANEYGQQVLNTLVEKVQGLPGEDICVIMCGYEREMREMFRTSNPGLARRFNLSNPVMFEDYDDAALKRILVTTARKERLQLDKAVQDRCLEWLSSKRAQGRFGNAGEVQNLLGNAKERYMVRVRRSSSSPSSSSETPAEPGGVIRLTVEDLLPKEDAEVGSGDPLAVLQSLSSMSSVEEQLRSFENDLKDRRNRGKKTQGSVGNFIFEGNSGTGKTTVARAMGKMLHGLKVLPRSDIVETTATDLTGEFLGQTKKRVGERMEQARGAVLFIDEAYALGRSQYGREALEKLLSLLTDDEYANNKVIIILAGYPADMQRMLERNQGLSSRFLNTVRFPDWTAEDCVTFFKDSAEKEGLKATEEGLSSALLNGFRDLRMRKGWANARDVLNFFQRARRQRANRVAKTPESPPTLIAEDVLFVFAEMQRERPNSGQQETVDVQMAGEALRVLESDLSADLLPLPPPEDVEMTPVDINAAPSNEGEGAGKEGAETTVSPLSLVLDQVFKSFGLSPQQQVDAVAGTSLPPETLQQVAGLLGVSETTAASLVEDARRTILERMRRAQREAQQGLLCICPVCGRPASQCGAIQAGLWASVQIPERI